MFQGHLHGMDLFHRREYKTLLSSLCIGIVFNHLDLTPLEISPCLLNFYMAIEYSIIDIKDARIIC